MHETAENGEVRNVKEEARHLVLGFDAGCSTCADLAKVIEERVGGRLSVRNLRDPEVQRWRERALGVAAPWAPTLFEVKGDEVRAWVGPKMGLALGRKIGPLDTWRVMQALGEIRAVPRIESAVEESALIEKLPETAQDALAGISRGQFLKGVGGAAVAATILAGGPLSSPAEAARRPSPYDIVKGRKITGAELTKAARQVGSSIDVKNLVGLALATPAKVTAAKPAGFRHTLRNGSLQRVLVFKLRDGRTVSALEFASPPRGTSRSRALLLTHDRRRSVITKASEGGMLWRVAARSRDSSRTSSRLAPLQECPPVVNTPPDPVCWREATVCTEWAWTTEPCSLAVASQAQACAGCVIAVGSAVITEGAAAPWAAGAAVVTCAGCLGIGSANTLYQCCAQRTETYIWACMGAPPR